MMSVVISFSGYQNSGKDTLAQFLIQNYSFTRLAFADYLKDLCAQEFNIPRNYFDDIILKDTPLPQYKNQVTPRELCIKIATRERAINPFILINKVITKIKQDPDKRYIITDCRKKLEIKTLHENFSTKYASFYIQRHNSPTYSIDTEIKKGDCDYIIDNTSNDITKAQKQLTNILNDLLA